MREDIYIERKIVSGRYISDGFADVLAEFEETELTPLQTAYISEKITSSNDTFVFLTVFLLSPARWAQFSAANPRLHFI